jgi:thiamine biosynthesis lipoprotein
MMGTFVGVAARGDDPDALERVILDVFGEMERLEAILSEWRPDSAVSRVSRSAGIAPIHVPAELMEVMVVAGGVSQATAGAFDSTWAALSGIWRVDDPTFRPPAAEVIAEARKLVDYRDVVLDLHRQTVFLRRHGMRLGLGGIAKAYIAEHAADLAVASGVGDILIDAGGDVVARGRNGDRPWTIGIRDPRNASALLATIELRDESVVTSGDYEHFVEIDGQRYHHLLDPRTGAPASKSQSATVVAPTGVLADALATGLFVLGYRSLDVVGNFDRVAALIVTKNGSMHISSGGAARFLDTGWLGS